MTSRLRIGNKKRSQIIQFGFSWWRKWRDHEQKHIEEVDVVSTERVLEFEIKEPEKL
jgi:hypothetical protein